MVSRVTNLTSGSITNGTPPNAYNAQLRFGGSGASPPKGLNLTGRIRLQGAKVHFGGGAGQAVAEEAIDLLAAPFGKALKKAWVLKPFKQMTPMDKTFHLTGVGGILGCVIDVLTTDRTLRKNKINDHTRKQLVKQEILLQIFNETNWFGAWYLWPLMVLLTGRGALSVLKTKPLQKLFSEETRAAVPLLEKVAEKVPAVATVFSKEFPKVVKNGFDKALTDDWTRQLLGIAWNGISFGFIRTTLMQNLFVKLFGKNGDMENRHNYVEQDNNALSSKSEPVSLTQPVRYADLVSNESLPNKSKLMVTLPQRLNSTILRDKGTFPPIQLALEPFGVKHPAFQQFTQPEVQLI